MEHSKNLTTLKIVEILPISNTRNELVQNQLAKRFRLFLDETAERAERAEHAKPRLNEHHPSRVKVSQWFSPDHILGEISFGGFLADRVKSISSPGSRAPNLQREWIGQATKIWCNKLLKPLYRGRRHNGIHLTFNILPDGFQDFERAGLSPENGFMDIIEQTLTQYKEKQGWNYEELGYLSGFFHNSILTLHLLLFPCTRSGKPLFVSEEPNETNKPGNLYDISQLSDKAAHLWWQEFMPLQYQHSTIGVEEPDLPLYPPREIDAALLRARCAVVAFKKALEAYDYPSQKRIKKQLDKRFPMVREWRKTFAQVLKFPHMPKLETYKKRLYLAAQQRELTLTIVHDVVFKYRQTYKEEVREILRTGKWAEVEQEIQLAREIIGLQRRELASALKIHRILTKPKTDTAPLNSLQWVMRSEFMTEPEKLVKDFLDDPHTDQNRVNQVKQSLWNGIPPAHISRTVARSLILQYVDGEILEIRRRREIDAGKPKEQDAWYLRMKYPERPEDICRIVIEAIQTHLLGTWARLHELEHLGTRRGGQFVLNPECQWDVLMEDIPLPRYLTSLPILQGAHADLDDLNEQPL